MVAGRETNHEAQSWKFLLWKLPSVCTAATWRLYIVESFWWPRKCGRQPLRQPPVIPACWYSCLVSDSPPLECGRTWWLASPSVTKVNGLTAKLFRLGYKKALAGFHGGLSSLICSERNNLPFCEFLCGAHEARTWCFWPTASEDLMPASSHVYELGLQADPATIKFWDDRDPGWHTDCSLVKDPELDAPS